MSPAHVIAFLIFSLAFTFACACAAKLPASLADLSLQKEHPWWAFPAYFTAAFILLMVWAGTLALGVVGLIFEAMTKS